MKAFDKPSVYLWMRLAYDNLFEGRTWHMKGRNDYHQTENVYSYQWGNRFINKKGNIRNENS